MAPENPKLPSQAEVVRELQRFNNLKQKIDKLEQSIADFEEQHEGGDNAISRNLENILELNDKALKTLPDISGTKDQVADVLSETKADAETIQTIRNDAEETLTLMQKYEATTKKVLTDAEKALTSATSAGLAKSFEARKLQLKAKEREWSVVLGLSLFVFSLIVYFRFEIVKNFLEHPETITASSFLLNLLATAAAIAAPVWLAWLATKQIGYYFRLTEDYAFKVATAASYEGFRREIESLSNELDKPDTDMRVQLLATLLKRLDEQPLRYVDMKVHGSPWEAHFEKKKEAK